MALKLQNICLLVDQLYNMLKPQFSLDYYYVDTALALDTDLPGLLAPILSKFQRLQGCRVTCDHCTQIFNHLTPTASNFFPRNLLEQATKGFLVRFGMPPHAHKQKD